MSLWDQLEDEDNDSSFELGIGKALTSVTDTPSHNHVANKDPMRLLTVGDNNYSELENSILTSLQNRELIKGGVVNVGAERITPETKRIIGGSSDVNQLIPFKYEWAWQKYLDACANHWMPTEINMNEDIRQWKDPDFLLPEERWLIESSLGYFSTADSIVVNNVVLNIYKRITAPECRQFLLRQAFEEAMHTHSYQYCIESLGMDQGKIFNLYREQPSMIIKDNWCFEFERKLNDPNCNDQDFLENLIGYYLMTEGLFFYCGFSSIFSMGRRQRMPGICEQFQYILRDESMHLNFGVDVINQIKQENPHLWTPALQRRVREIIAEGRLIETAYAKDLIPNGLPGMNIKMMTDYLGSISNRRCEQVGVPAVSKAVENPFPWMAEMIDLRKEKNFFETRVTDYQTGGAIKW